MNTAIRFAKILRRPFLLAVIYTAIFVLSFVLSYELRFDFDPPERYARQLLLICLWAIPLKLIALRVYGHFNELLSYFGTPDLQRVLGAVATSSGLLLVARAVPHVFFAAPRGVIVTDFVLSIAGICSVRLALRTFRERTLGRQRATNKTARRVAIIGAGDVGAALARELISKRWLAMHPVAFFDDFKAPHSSVHGIPVFGPPEALLDSKLDARDKLRIQEVIIAMPSASPKRIAEIVKILQQVGLKMKTVPSMAQLASGQVKVSALRAVEIQDLLGRATVEIDSANVERSLAGRVVMVTGAGGSIGSELCRQIAGFGPAKLLLVERSEPQLFAIEQELLQANVPTTIVPLVADILEVSRIARIFTEFKPDVIFHAAAHKHVPMMEQQPAEAVKNNSIGTAHLATLAAHHGINRFVLISTDKAINPTSVMGASKRLAEMFLQALHASGDSPTKFVAVRFGNVLGSSGSVVPIFSQQIAAGGPVKVTHPDVTRYFMTIPEASRLVLQSAAQGDGGEIFVLDMGKPVKILDLARQMIELSGLVPYKDIDILVTGLRPGEKLFEELSHKGENLRPTHHPKIMRFVTDPLPLSFVKTAIEEFVRCINVAEPQQVKAMLKALIPEYRPFGAPDEKITEFPPRRGPARPVVEAESEGYAHRTARIG